MAEKTIVLITGANAGLGFETVKALVTSPKPYHIFLGSRSVSRGNDALAQLAEPLKQSASTVEVLEIDMESDGTIKKAAETVSNKFGRLDALVNNAGSAFDRLFADDAADFRTLFNKSFDVNVTGPQVTTTAFAPLLLKSSDARLVFLTSGTATLIGNQQGLIPARGVNVPPGFPKAAPFVGAQAYKAAKTAINMQMLTWHWFLQPDGVKTWSVSPGFLATNLTGDPESLKKAGAGDPALGGNLLRQVLEGERDGDVGRVVMQNGALQDW